MAAKAIMIIEMAAPVIGVAYAQAIMEIKIIIEKRDSQ